MTITKLSSREFQQNANLAQKASNSGPVFITNRGKPAQVLLSIKDYQQMIGMKRNLVEALSMPGLGELDFDLTPSRQLPRSADMS
jgi:prevent-host-death family protein